MKTQAHLIKNVIGQLEGIGRMLEEGEDCRKVIIQMKAARSALANVMDKYVQENVSRCLNAKGKKKSDPELEKLISELIRNK